LNAGSSLLLFLADTGRVEVREVAAFGAVGGVDDAVDESRTARHERAGEGDGELGGRRGLVALSCRKPYPAPRLVAGRQTRFLLAAGREVMSAVMASVYGNGILKA
jgi:hypothetical protein